MYRVKLVGAGQLGSRHLQALQAVSVPLEIQVIDPSVASLQVAKERFEAIKRDIPHQIVFTQDFVDTELTDIAIVATNANVRCEAINKLLASSRVKHLVLEKLLFTEREDYVTVQKLISDVGIGAWVNCPMRVMPVYESIRANLGGVPISYRVTGSQFGLVTNAIHYLDHVAHLAGCDSYQLNVSGLSRTPVSSKRAGFLEMNGTLSAAFADGSRCEISCYPGGNAPVVVEIFNESHRYVVRESEGKLWRATARENWSWAEEVALIPYQSQITTGVVESLLRSGECGLTSYASSARLHLALLDPLLDFVRAVSPEVRGYPFT